MLHTFTLGKSPLKKKKYKRIVRQLYELADEGYIPLFGKKLPPQIHIQGWPGITLVLRDKVVPRLEHSRALRHPLCLAATTRILLS